MIKIGIRINLFPFVPVSTCDLGTFRCNFSCMSFRRVDLTLLQAKELQSALEEAEP